MCSSCGHKVVNAAQRADLYQFCIVLLGTTLEIDSRTVEISGVGGGWGMESVSRVRILEGRGARNVYFGIVLKTDAEEYSNDRHRLDQTIEELLSAAGD